MSDELSVSPEGFQAGSAALADLTGQVLSVDGQNIASGEQSSAGAAAFAQAVEAFSRAFAGRVGDRGQSAQVAAAAYTRTDNDASGNITAASM